MTPDLTKRETPYWGIHPTSVGPACAYTVVYDPSQAPHSVAGAQEEIVPRSDADLDAIFEVLAEPLEQETRVLSSPTSMLKHQSVATLRRLGEANVIPRILARLDRNPVMWMTLLGEFSGENPVPEHEWGRVDSMARYWREWGHSKGYI